MNDTSHHGGTLVPSLAAADADWLLVLSKPRQEQVALENLRNQGYHSYLPLRPVEKLRRGKLVQVLEPLFARYLFLRAGDPKTTSYSPVRSTKGVSTLVRFGEQPARVPAALIQEIRRMEAHWQAHPAQRFQAGEPVRIVEGPFRGLNALFEMNDGEARAMVLIELMGKPVQVALAPTQFEAHPAR